ncbi:MAG: YcnI family protein [Acidobacteria bacterium]|nr:YcnI family protein [Acidobacteriota bacterium]
MRPTSRRWTVRLVTGVLGGAIAVLLGATAASAHVHVDGEDATRGGYGVLTFRVPTESATASTTEVTVTLPADHPIASVSVEPVAGWTATVTSARLAKPVTTDDGQVTTYASRIDWKADASAAIKPGEFQRFSVSAGPLPDVASIALPTTQRYSDGTVVAWDQLATGSAEPTHPAPVLALAAAQTPTAPSATSSTADPGSGTATAALAVAVVAVAAALTALVVAIIGLLRGSRRGRA